MELANNQFNPAGFSDTASWLSTQARRKTNLINEGIVSRDERDMFLMSITN
jgi:hypothetical protein